MIHAIEYQPRSWAYAGGAAVIATWLNATVYVVGVGVGIFSSLRFSPTRGGELTIGPILIASFLVPIFGYLTYAALSRRKHYTYEMFRDGVWIAVVASLVLPLIMAPWNLAQIMMIQFMHVVAGACTLYGINTSRW